MPDIFKRFQLTSVQSGATQRPAIHGIDAEELFDTRELVRQVQDMITNKKPRVYQPPGNSTL